MCAFTGWDPEAVFVLSLHNWQVVTTAQASGECLTQGMPLCWLEAEMRSHRGPRNSESACFPVAGHPKSGHIPAAGFCELPRVLTNHLLLMLV